MLIYGTALLRLAPVLMPGHGPMSAKPAPHCRFNVYTTQPVIKSGCVLRRANVGVLERESLVTQHEVDLCKSRMNTFAYMVGATDRSQEKAIGGLKGTRPLCHCLKMNAWWIDVVSAMGLK